MDLSGLVLSSTWLAVDTPWLVLDLFESTWPLYLFRAVSTTSEVGSLETSSRTPDCGAGAFPEHDSRDGVDNGLT